MRPEALVAFEVGIFGVVLVSLCAMLLGLLGLLIPLNPIVYFSSMAGVMLPAVMVAAGGLALWASHNPFRPEAWPRGGAYGAMAMSLIAGLTVMAGATLLLVLAMVVPLEVVYPSGRLYFESPDAFGFLGAAVLVAAYVALAVIGGALYGIVVPEGPARY